MKFFHFSVFLTATSLFTFYTSNLFGQKLKEISFDAGNVISLYDLRTRPYNNDKAISLNSWGGTLQFNHQLWEKIYFTGMGSVSFLATNPDFVKDVWKTGGFTIKSAEGGTYKMFGLSGGLKYYFLHLRKFDIAAAIRAGVEQLVVSDLVYSFTNITGTAREKWQYDISFLLNGELECSYNLSESMGLTFNLKYFKQNSEFDYTHIHNDNSQTYSYGANGNLKTDRLMATLGIKFRFKSSGPLDTSF